MFMATHSPDTITDYHADDASAHADQYGNTQMGTWICQTKNCQQGIQERTQQRIEYARKKTGARSEMPKDIICNECYGSLLDGTSIALKDAPKFKPGTHKTNVSANLESSNVSCNIL